jgi:DNA polymerase III sliding clamp (beta) subunit (PCNA family)
VKDQETQKFLDIFNNLPRGKFFLENKNLFMEIKSSLSKGQDLYQEFFKRIPESERKFIKNFQKQKISNGIKQTALCAEDGKFGQAVPKNMGVFAGIGETAIPLGLEFLK